MAAAAAAAAAAAQQQALLQAQQQAMAAEMQQREESRSFFQQSLEAEVAASEVVAHVVHLATDVMIANHLDRLAIPYTVRCLVKETLDFIQAAFVGQDDGAVVDRHWHVDPQPQQVIVDPWARAAIGLQQPNRRLGNGAELGDLNAPQSLITTVSTAIGGKNAQNPNKATGSSKKQVAGNLPAPLSKSGKSPAPLSGAVAGPSVVSTSASSVLGPTSKQPRATAGSKVAGGGGNGASSSGGAPSGGGGSGNGDNGAPLTAEEAEYLEHAKEAAKRRAEARALQERISKQLDDMKNQSAFTVDGATGRVIPLSTFDPSAARRGAAEPQRFVISTAPVAPESLGPVKAPPGAAPRGLRAAAGGGPSSAPAVVQGGTGGNSPGASPTTAAAAAAASRGPRLNKKPEASDFYVEEASYGPMVDAIAPAGGVSVRDKDVTLKGELKVPKTRVSRAEYQKMASVGLYGIGASEDGDSPAQEGIAQAPPQPLRGAAPPGAAISQPTHNQLAPPAVTAVSGVAASAEYRPQQLASLPAAKLSKQQPDASNGSPRAKRAELAKQLAQSGGPSQRRSTKVQAAGSLSDDEYS